MTVKETCATLGISQGELAEVMGVARSTIDGWATQKEPSQIAKNFMKTLVECEACRRQLARAKDAAAVLREMSEGSAQ